jgi:eukaryotic-like serine/threonine-protein kinase
MSAVFGTRFPCRIGRYRLLAPIGKGGMATVYLGEAEGIGGFKREVAVKVLHEHLQTDPDLVARFVEEAKLAARIRHPNVVTVTDVAADELGVHLVMEHVDGDSLGGLSRAAAAGGHPIPTRVAMRILTDALSGLHAAHELVDEDGAPLELVHRDFSPQNILVGLDGIARLTDFGVAKLAARQSQTASGVIKGKVRYMSPEQVRGAALDRRCDIWAAGVVTWEILARQRMHRSKDDVATMFEIVTHSPPRLSSVRDGVPAELDDVVASALAVDPADRFATAEQFRARLLASFAVAEIDEVARYVRDLTHDKLTARRERIRALAESEGSADPTEQNVSASGSADWSAPASTSLSPLAERGDTLTTSSSPIASRWRPRRSHSLVAASVGLLAVIAAGYAFWSSTQAPSPVAMPALPADSAPSLLPSKQPAAPAAPAAPSSATAVRISANAPLSAIVMDGQRHAISPPARSTLITRPRSEGRIEIVATASDGRRSVAQLEPGAEALEIRFAAVAKPRSAKPRASAGATTPPILAPWPARAKP